MVYNHKSNLKAGLHDETPSLQQGDAVAWNQVGV